MAYSSGSFTNTLDYPQTLSYNCAAVSGEFETPTWLQIVRAFKSLQVCKQGVLKAGSRDTRYQDMLEILNMPSLAARRRQRKLCTLYKVNNNLSEYPSPLLIPRDPYFSSCSVHCLSFVRPYAHTNQYFLFPPHTISLYNNLPYNVVSTFKCHISEVCLSLELFMHPLLVLITSLYFLIMESQVVI